MPKSPKQPPVRTRAKPYNQDQRRGSKSARSTSNGPKLRGTSSKNVPRSSNSTTPSASSSKATIDPAEAVELTQPKGRKIMRTDAMNWFKLSPAQMDRAFPISANANKYGGITRVYNESDVVALAKKLAAAGNPSQFNEPRYAQRGTFDGLDRTDAAELLFELTGIVDTSIFEDDY